AKVNCSQPDQSSLFAALSPAFNLKAIRPVENQSTYTNISVYFTLYGILGVIFFLLQWWKNEFISWEPEQCGTDMIPLPKENFWLPDVVINEFMEENKAPTVPYLSLYHDGRVVSSFPVRVVSSCNLNIYTFPFDIQNCSLTFNSYIYYVFLVFGIKTTILMTTMGEWELLDITAQKLGMFSLQIRVRRRATMYVVTLLLPSCFLITVDLFSFLLPPQSTDRSSFKMTLILGYTVFLLIMNDLLPVTGNTIPLINVFFSLCLALMVASLLETIFITNLFSNLSELSPVPRWIRVIVLNFLGYLVCMPRKNTKPKDLGMQPTSSPSKNHYYRSADQDEALQELRSLSNVLKAIRSEVEQQHNGSQSSEEWMQVGFIIDRLLFGVYIVFISVSFITIIVVWVNSYNQ
uniref:Neurotransmitter-gated ion-channel ligand-binding domain-containing protein n=1 Tax=Cyprinodon variegatus TaxID=28743 RepID=A0A3Q2D0Q2_CYPVA